MVLTLKIVFIFTILIIAGIAGYLPIFVPALHRDKKFLSFGNCFAAGIFIVVGIGHLLSDGNEAFRSSIDNDMPIPNLLAVCGYLLIFFVETQLFGSAHNHKSHSHFIPKQNPINSSTSNKDVLVNVDEIQGLESESIQQVQANAIPGIFLALALAVHSIFEGIAVGLLSSESGVITVSVAIIIHKIPAAVALGIAMEGIKRLLYCVLMGIFVLSTPLGIAIGIFLSDLGGTLIQGVFLSISAGTFMYIGCSEILPQEMANEYSSRGKFFAFCLGCIPLGVFLLFFS